MGAYDGEEVYEPVGNYLLYELSELYEKKDIGLYRDNGFASLRIKVDQNQKELKKSLQNIFRENELRII